MLSTLALLCVASGSVAKEDIDTQASLSHFRAAEQTRPFFKSAYGYAVFPSVGKGGFWIGGAYGSGTVYKNHIATGSSKLYQVSFGLQFGGQSYSEIIFFQDKRAYERFTSGSFELDAQASAVALTEGAQAKAGTAGLSASSGQQFIDASYTNGIAVFTYAKGGMMIEASLAGQTFSFEPLVMSQAQETDTQHNNEPASVVVKTLERPE
ncbi:lipid-binding SYLF domain-containing protein [Photobacterium sp. SDRW27]|nr:lipid-binding SYLF domain-containing protein [Photobacterium obscurum]MCW8331802.1 lipid-binding SYLF domain-containing protein [Photobacterium obscurum]